MLDTCSTTPVTGISMQMKQYDILILDSVSNTPMLPLVKDA